MKRSLTISVTMVVLLMLALFTYFHFINPFCGWGSNYGNLGKLGVASKSACDKSCVSDSDCQPFVGSCININEKPYFPSTLSVAFMEVACSCSNKVCVGNQTGRIAI